MSLLYRYHAWAFALESWLGSDVVPHICAGLGIWLIGALLLRRPLRDPFTLLPVMLAEGANEACDYIVHIGWSFGDTAHDIAWTLFWPVVIQQFLARGRR
jgi:hypothetical protein